ncbi:MAG: xanthine dehydrogenase family protein molybdopterin-binding subunit [Alphaproteobacteria bacterium]|nr:xanthine dehydrogenase family protein molybdopterin-binding subunit [Alphaproteobacteria bacterium]
MSDTGYKFSSAQAGDHDELNELVQGRGTYTSDISLPGQLHACFVRSPWAHARITTLSTEAALALPGVRAVVTARDVAQAGLGSIMPLVILKGSNGQNMHCSGMPLLAEHEVRHVGEPVALVVAETLEQAMNGAEAVVIDYDPLPCVTDLRAAVAADAPQVQSVAPGNIAMDWSLGETAELQAAFAQAHHVQEIELADPMLTGAPMEPKAALAQFDASSGRYTLIASTQGVKNIQHVLSQQVFKVPAEQVRVLTPKVGGGFGLKSQTYPEQAVLLLAARLTGQPVKWTATRLECFLTDTHGRNTHIKGQMAFDAQGRITALRADFLCGVGAYTSGYIGVVSTMNIYNCLSSVYRMPVLSMRSRLVHTHVMAGGPYRGAGRPEAIYLVEQLLDAVAPRLGLDRIELRRRNLVPVSAMPYKAANGQTYDSGEFEAILDKALALADWSGFEARRQESARRGLLRGIGVCCFLEVAGGILEEPADIRFTPEGKVALHLGSQGMGQGVHAIYPKLVAQKLGVSLSDVILVTGDSDIVPGSVPTVASRTTMMAGTATTLACEESIRRGRPWAARALEAAADDLRFESGRYVVAGTDHGIDLLEVARQVRQATQVPEGWSPTLDNISVFKAPSLNYPNGCHISEVEIDPETGVVDFVVHTAVDDAGVMLDPVRVEGQIMGGVAQGLGQVMGEMLHYDEQGQLLNASYMDYPMPRSDNVPPMRLAHHEVPCTTHPLGVKGAGESGVAGAWPAAVSAVLDALRQRGVEHMDLPFTPDRVWRTLQG